MVVTTAIGALVIATLALITTSLDRGGSQPSLPDPGSVYDPVEAGEPRPPGYRRVMVREAIPPVYTPRFTGAGRVDWPGETLVIGVKGASTAKAYPVTHLNVREMVIDSLDGIPILVTW